jgi:imidazolonepropionase-like amidohydrolase
MTRQRIDAEVLLPGRGEAQRAASVVLDGRSIAYVGPTATAPDAESVVRVPVVMPGMWDCHGHFTGLRTANLEDVVRVPPVLAAARATKDAEAALQAGFTSIREAGGIGLEIARAIDEGTVAGPTIYSAGAILSMTGGHGDLHTFPLDAVHAYAHTGGLIQLADGVPECLRAVRLQLRRGAKVIKICASGGVTSELDDPVHQQFSAEELRAIVQEAARADRIVMAHCHGKAGIMAALEAGCHTIEHGSYLDAEAADLMAERGAILVPTRFIIDRLLQFGRAAAMPEYSYRKLQFIADSHLKAIAVAHSAGVRIAVGTDIFMTGADMPVPWGGNGGEVPLLAAAGLSAAEAVEAATANGPLTLGPQAPMAGILEVGYDADVIAVASDPLADPTVLGEASNVTHVWKRGALVKSPLPV